MISNTKHIAILGCGWLGLPLAKELIEKGHRISGTTTSADKLAILEAAGISPFLVELTEKEIRGDLETFLNSAQILVIDIPPKLRGLNSESFVKKIQHLIPYIEASSVEKVLFISSTSVYADDTLFSEVDEDTLPHPISESGKQLLVVERLLKANLHFETSILRFGGLIGNGRHPIKQLAGKSQLKNPNAPVNLIHIDDAIGIIVAILKKDKWGTLLNAVAPFHEEKERYYEKMASIYNLSTPIYDSETPSKGKKIGSKSINDILSYTFKVKNLLIKV
ncbi:SDR family oxidoreductase [Sungkyunkwania multivorans]|uniref:SDR family oxidoreductase n=1 Tax=Sungkyunkwania multivorans TaxID=1173618 RepID=A0ABW3CZV9_9FLAO